MTRGWWWSWWDGSLCSLILFWSINSSSPTNLIVLLTDLLAKRESVTQREHPHRVREQQQQSNQEKRDHKTRNWVKGSRRLAIISSNGRLLRKQRKGDGRDDDIDFLRNFFPACKSGSFFLETCRSSLWEEFLVSNAIWRLLNYDFYENWLLSWDVAFLFLRRRLLNKKTGDKRPNDNFFFSGKVVVGIKFWVSSLTLFLWLSVSVDKICKKLLWDIWVIVSSCFLHKSPDKRNSGCVTQRL